MKKPDRLDILITSGPTFAPIDAMRFLSNRSTGEVGALLAQEAETRGARVTLVHGKGSILPAFSRPEKHRLVEITTIRDLAVILEEELNKKIHHAALHAMAVLDFVPERVREEKVSSTEPFWDLRLIRTPKIIRLFKELQPDIFLVAFKLEAGLPQEELHAKALAALREYNADLVVANDLAQMDRNAYGASILDRDGELLWRGEGKENLAEHLLRILEEKIPRGTAQ